MIWSSSTLEEGTQFPTFSLRRLAGSEPETSPTISAETSSGELPSGAGAAPRPPRDARTDKVQCPWSPAGLAHTHQVRVDSAAVRAEARPPPRATDRSDSLPPGCPTAAGWGTECSGWGRPCSARPRHNPAERSQWPGRTVANEKIHMSSERDIVADGVT